MGMQTAYKGALCQMERLRGIHSNGKNQIYTVCLYILHSGKEASLDNFWKKTSKTGASISYHRYAKVQKCFEAIVFQSFGQVNFLNPWSLYLEAHVLKQ